jgi:hypothetical protein
MNKYLLIKLVCLLNLLLSILACTDQSLQTTNPVSYSRDIIPVINAYCIECHNEKGKGFSDSGLNMETYEALIKGTKHGPVINPGNSLSSTLVILIEGRADKSINMPHGTRKPLAPETIEMIKHWIDQGAKKN